MGVFNWIGNALFCGEGRCEKPGIHDMPGEWALPWVGTRWLTTKLGRYSMPQLHNAYKDMHVRFGPIMREVVWGNIALVSLFHGADIEKVTEASFSSDCPVRPPIEILAMYRASRPDLYSNGGIVNEQGAAWRALRSGVARELERKTAVARFVPDLDGVARDFVELLRDARDATRRVRDLPLLVKQLGLESVCTLVLGRRIQVLGRNDDTDMVKLVRLVEQHFGAIRDSQHAFFPLWKFEYRMRKSYIIPLFSKLSTTYSLFDEAEREFYRIISGIVHRAIEDEVDTSECESIQKIFMSILSADGLDERDKKSAIIDFITSGVITLGNTLLFVLYHLAKNPDVQEKLYESLPSAATPITVQELKNAEYLDAVVKETYRIQPTATQIARILEEDMDLSGYHLPAGTPVLCHNWIACLDENNFTHANEFIPERWLSDESCAGWNFSPKLVAPFGYGKRKCPGENFSDRMLHLLLARMVQVFRMDYDGELKMKFEFLLVPEEPIKLILHDRQ